MIANFVSETISAGGTGNLTLSGAVDTAHVTFNAALGTNMFFYYVAEDGNDKELGIGHLSTSNTLVRDTVVQTLVSGTLDNSSPSALNLSTSTIVSINATAQTAMPPFSPHYFSGSGGANGQSANGFAGVPTLSVDLSANVAIFTPCFLPPMLMNSVDVACTVASASSGVHIGAYRRSSNGNPGDIFANFTLNNPINTGTTGQKTATLATPVWFPGGDFWMCVLTDNSTVDLRGFPISQSAHHSMGLNSSGSAGVTLTKGQTYGNLPTNFPNFTVSGSFLQSAFYIK